MRTTPRWIRSAQVTASGLAPRRTSADLSINHSVPGGTSLTTKPGA